MKLVKKIQFLFLLTLIDQIYSKDLLDFSKLRECHSCEGINCLRTNYAKIVNCSDPLDICVTIFDSFSVAAQGCLLDLPEHHRNKCDKSNNLECHKCYTSLCNNLGREDFKCFDCDSSKNTNCTKNSLSLLPVRCPIPSTLNSYCYIQYLDGKTVRGCSTNLKHQRDCLENKDCTLCLPSDSNDACNGFNPTEDDPEIEPTEKPEIKPTEKPNPNNSNKAYLGLGTILLLIANIFLN